MHRGAGIAVVLFLSSLVLSAQEPARVEVFVGYSFAGIATEGFVNTLDTNFNKQHPIHNGWNGALDVNVNKLLAVVADFGGYYGSRREPAFTPMTCLPCITVPGASDATRIHTYMFGPQASFRFRRITPFVHGLFGGAHANGKNTLGVFPFPSFSSSTTGYAFAVGGGLDANFSRHLGFRVQGDYLRASLFQVGENNFRFSTGLVVRFGS